MQREIQRDCGMHAGAPRRHVTVDFRGAFYVPAVNAKPAPLVRNTLAAAVAAQNAPEDTAFDGEEFLGAVIDPESARAWLVVNPCTLLVRASPGCSCLLLVCYRTAISSSIHC